jgi:hypothetical protein
MKKANYYNDLIKKLEIYPEHPVVEAFFILYRKKKDNQFHLHETFETHNEAISSLKTLEETKGWDMRIQQVVVNVGNIHLCYGED